MSATSIASQDPNLSTIPDEEKSRIKAAIEDPVLFSKIFLQTDCWEVQAQIMRELTKPRCRVAVKACHSSSKTFTAALALLWFLARYTEAIVVTTAPTWNQVKKLLWGEVHSLLAKSLYPYPEANQVELNFISKGYPKRYAQGHATTVTKEDEGVKFQGYHAPYVLMILDEAPGVDPKIWEAIDGIRAGGDVRMLCIGNPTISSGPFYDAFREQRGAWKTYTISAFNTPNFRGLSSLPLPEGKTEASDLERFIDYGTKNPDWLNDNPLGFLTTRSWVYEKYFEWGPGHPLWESRVLGNFAKQSPDALLSLDWLEKAAIKEGKSEGRFRAGLDVAGPGEDETVLTVVCGQTIIFQKTWPIPDPRGEIIRELAPYKDKLDVLNVDVIGVGWGIYLHLKDQKLPCIAINVCEKSSDSEKFADCKAEFYWGLRLRLQQGDMSGLYNGVQTLDEKTIGQLAGIRWRTNPRGQIEIESKEEAKKRGVKHSPDRAESIMLAYAHRDVVYGVLELGKEMMIKTQASTMIKPGMVDRQLLCPKCDASCVSMTNGQWRCNQCGHFWRDPDTHQFVISKKSRSNVFQK